MKATKTAEVIDAPLYDLKLDISMQPDTHRQASPKEIARRASEMIFGNPLVTNVYRSVVVEAIVADALPEWTWCSADYFAYDFMHPVSKIRLEVKQSTIKQTWKSNKPGRPSWDIKPRQGFYIGADFTSQPGRNADIYVLGLHTQIDDRADHRDPMQWRFFVISAAALPSTQRLSVGTAERLTRPVGPHELAREVSSLTGSMPRSSL